MKNFKQKIESLAVYLILIFILFPTRLALVTYVSENWFISFGVMISISVCLIYLSKKGKLGWFGRALHRQLFKIHKGKRRYFVYFQVISATLYFSVTIYGIGIGDTLIEEKQILKDKIGIDTMEEFAEKSKNEIRPNDIPMALYALFYILFFRFDIFAVIMSTINDMSHGYVLHISTVLLVEEIELIGILILTKLTIKQEQI